MLAQPPWETVRGAPSCSPGVQVWGSDPSSSAHSGSPFFGWWLGHGLTPWAPLAPAWSCPLLWEFSPLGLPVA